MIIFRRHVKARHHQLQSFHGGQQALSTTDVEICKTDIR